jgi:hypothetical protein
MKLSGVTEMESLAASLANARQGVSRSVMTEDRLRSYGVFLLRVALGTMFIAHSIIYMLMTLTLAGTAKFFVSIGLPACMGSISSMALRNASTLSSSVANLVQVFSRDKKCSRASGIAASVASSA